MSNSEEKTSGELEAGSIGGLGAVLNPGMIKLTPPEAEWLMNVAGLHAMQIQKALANGQVPEDQREELIAQMKGLFHLAENARKALVELMPEFAERTENHPNGAK